MRHIGREVISWTDYILGTDIHMFWNVSVRESQHNLDHFMVLGCLHGTSQWDHTSYMVQH